MDHRRPLERCCVLLAAALATVAIPAIGGDALSASAAGALARTVGYRILLKSDRDGATRAYSMRLDGSALTPLLRRSSKLLPAAASRDGGTIAWVEAPRLDAGGLPEAQRRDPGIYLSRADGTGLRRVVREGGNPALSRDGRLLAFTRTGSDGAWIVGADKRGSRRLTRRADFPLVWSPDGKAVAFFRNIGDEVQALVVQPLHGSRRVLASGDFYDVGPELDWSPDGRWIAYLGEEKDSGRANLWLIGPNGERRHRIARDAGAFAWSPDSKSVAFTSRGEVVVVGTDGRGSRLHLPGVSVEALMWSPDGRRLVLTSGVPKQIWIAGRDGRGLHRVTAAGDNVLVGSTRLAPVLPPARPIAPTERVVSTHSLVLRAPVRSVAADGPRVAFMVGSTRTDCIHIAVWTPSRKSIRRLWLPAPCVFEDKLSAIGPVALGGTRVAWLWTSLTGNTMETNEITSDGEPFDTVGIGRGDGVGSEDQPPVGDGTLIAFAVEESCDAEEFADDCPPGHKTGDVVATTVYRFGGPGPCPLSPRASPPPCTLIAKVDGKATLLAVDAGRIVLGTDSGIQLLAQDSRVLQQFALTADAAALSGNKLALQTFEGVKVYDVRTGLLTGRFPALSDLQDLQGDILVTYSGGGFTLRRLSDGRKTTIPATGDVLARLERPGLFLAGAHRITFTPMRELLRRLGG